MKTLITPVEVLRRAFGSAEPMPPDTVTEADIVAAEHRYIRPVIGGRLHEELLGGAHAGFTEEFLAQAVALFTRLLIQPRLAARSCAAGVVSPKSSTLQPADRTAQRAHMNSLRGEARTLLLRASDHLRSRATEYPAYDPQADILTRCRIHGDLVQNR